MRHAAVVGAERLVPGQGRIGEVAPHVLVSDEVRRNSPARWAKVSAMPTSRPPS